MADIFISYSQKDRKRVKPLVDALTAERYEVWWDIDVRSGESFDEAIERNLKRVRCVVTIWSKSSVSSKWVRAESAWAADRNKVVSIRIEDDLDLPVRFYNVQTSRLVGWDGSRDAPAFRKLVKDIRKIAGKPPSPFSEPESPVEPPAGTEWSPGQLKQDSLIRPLFGPRDLLETLDSKKADEYALRQVKQNHKQREQKETADAKKFAKTLKAREIKDGVRKWVKKFPIAPDTYILDNAKLEALVLERLKLQGFDEGFTDTSLQFELQPSGTFLGMFFIYRDSTSASIRARAHGRWEFDENDLILTLEGHLAKVETLRGVTIASTQLLYGSDLGREPFFLVIAFDDYGSLKQNGPRLRNLGWIGYDQERNYCQFYKP
jgi:hypothetical protein